MLLCRNLKKWIVAVASCRFFSSDSVGCWCWRRLSLHFWQLWGDVACRQTPLEGLFYIRQAGPAEDWSGDRGHSSSAAGASKLCFSKIRNGAFSERNEHKMKQKLRWHMHVLSSKLNKFITYNVSLEWNFEPLMVNGKTVVLNHANQEVGSWFSSKTAYVSIISCMSFNTDPV